MTNLLDLPIDPEVRTSGHKFRQYKKEWERFEAKMRRGAFLLSLMGCDVDGIVPAMDWEDVCEDHRPVVEVKSGADQGSRQRAAKTVGWRAARRDAMEDKADEVLARADKMRAALGGGGGRLFTDEEVDDFIFTETCELDSVVPEGIDEGAMVLDLMSVDVPEEHACSAAPMGDLYGETLYWKRCNVELVVEDGEKRLRVWSDGKVVKGVLNGRQERFQRWARSKGYELAGVEDPRFRRGDDARNNERRRQDKVAEALAEALRMVEEGCVPDPSVMGKGRPKWVYVALTALGELEVGACASWVGRTKVAEAMLDAIVEQSDKVLSLA